MSDTCQYKKLIDLLRGHRVFIQTHNFPDPDALASAQGLKVFLRAHGIDSVICYEGNIEKISTRKMIDKFEIEAFHIQDIHDMTKDDYIVAVDAQKYNSNMTDFIGDEVACIDHHPTMIACYYQYKDIRIVGACATLIAQYFAESGTAMDTTTATMLLYGIKMDTDSFTRGVTELDIEMFAYLHKLANDRVIRELYNNNMEIEDLHAYGEAIRNIRIYDDIGFANISFDCPDALIAMISDFILALDVVEFAVVYAVRDGGLKFSVRNENQKYHAGDLTAKALKDIGGGGGHYAMAGGMVPAEYMDELEPDVEGSVRNRFLDAIEEMKKEQEHEVKKDN